MEPVAEVPSVRGRISPACAQDEKQFPATTEGLAAAADYLRAALDASGCEARSKSQLMVAMDEIVSNIVFYSGAPDFTLEIVFSGDPPDVRLVFSDAGRPYDPLGHADPDVTLPAEARDIGGLGLFMVKKLMDDVAYRHEDGRNVLTLCKRAKKTA